jgi:hypothetical protein
MSYLRECRRRRVDILLLVGYRQYETRRWSIFDNDDESVHFDALSPESIGTITSRGILRVECDDDYFTSSTSITMDRKFEAESYVYCPLCQGHRWGSVTILLWMRMT